MRIAICDDEKPYRDTIAEYLQPYLESNEKITYAEYDNGEALLSSYENKEYFDIIFLDIKMYALDGVSTAKKLREINDDFILIFITSHTQFVSDAFTLNAFQFLTKPLKQESFNKELERAIITHTKKKYKHEICYKGKLVYLELKDIIFIETYNRRLKATTASCEHEYLGNINTEEKKLSEYNFLRCHQGYIVNMYHIRQYHKNLFLMSNEIHIPVSKHLKSRVLEKYNKFSSRCCV